MASVSWTYPADNSLIALRKQTAAAIRVIQRTAGYRG
jgi:hypothetical protein